MPALKSSEEDGAAGWSTTYCPTALELCSLATEGTQLLDSIGQTNRVLLNMQTDYNARLLAKDIRRYFELNANAVEVLIMKGAHHLCYPRRYPWPVVHQKLHDEVQTKIKSNR